MLAPLPIDARLPAVVAALAARRAAVLVATPGAGKTTRVPPALVDHGPRSCCSPAASPCGRWRRASPRNALDARPRDRLAHPLRETLRADDTARRRHRRILTARLQQDPLLSDVTTVVLDEFHERSIHADLGLALVRQAWLARDDLRVLVMSATLDTAPVARFLGDCPVIDVPGTTHPLTIDYAPGEAVPAAVRHVWPRASGHVLCFLPGAREIERARTELTSGQPGARCRGAAAARLARRRRRDAALRPSTRRRVIATNLAETSLTVPASRRWWTAAS
jgi:ATP-dependent helicase HrpB